MIDAGGGGPAKPPFVIRSTSRLITGAVFVLFAVAIGAAYSEAPKGSKGSPLVSAVIGLVLAALAIRVGAVRVRASADGLLVRNTWRTRTIPWRDVVEVQVVRLARSWRRPFFVPNGGLGITVHRRDGDEVLLEATVRRRFREPRGETYGPPFDGWLAGLEAFRRPWSARWN